MRAAVILSILVPVATAHVGCGGVHIGRRNTGGRLIQARDAPTDESSAAQSLDPTQECTPYTYQPVSDIKSKYPTPWIETGADIVSGDSEATSIFQQINATLNQKFPDIHPKGQTNGNFTGIKYDATDPDCWWTWHQCDTPASDTGLPADITIVPEPMTWGLGFDDGPNCSHNALYDTLKADDQKATMFFIGSNVMDWPLQALRAVDEGHQICVHTWSHQYMTAFSNQQAFAELYYTRQVIKDLLGVTPKCWRPPYGDVDNRIRTIANSLNLTTIVWSDDTEDWKEGVAADGVTPQDVADNYQAIIGKTKNGTYDTHGPIVLNHELTNFTMTAFSQQWQNIKSAFKYVVPICTAMNDTHPYVETNITCPSFETYLSGTHNTSSSTPDTGGASASGSASPSGTSGSKVAAASASHSGAASRSVSVGFNSGATVTLLGGLIAGGMAILF